MLEHIAGIEDTAGFCGTCVTDLRRACHEAVEDYFEPGSLTDKEPS